MIKEIEYVIKIAECRSFSAAAAELHISQPALSRFVQTLENNLELKLFERKSHGTILTVAGELYYKHALAVREQLNGLRDEMKSLAQKQKNVLRAATIRHSDPRPLTRCIELFRKMHPETELTLAEELSQSVEQGVRNGSFDIGFMSEPCVMERLEFYPQEKNYLVLALCRDRIPAGAVIKERRDLPFPWADIHSFREVDFVLQGMNTRMRNCVDDFFLREKFIPSVSMTTQSSLDTLHFASLGLGAAISTPGYVRRIDPEEKLAIFCVGNPVALICHGYIVRKDSIISKSARDFIRLYFECRKKNRQQAGTSAPKDQ